MSCLLCKETQEGSWRSMPLSNILGFCAPAEHHISSRGSKAILVALFTQCGKGSIFCFSLVPKNPLKIINFCLLPSACDTEEIEHRPLCLHPEHLPFASVYTCICHTLESCFYFTNPPVPFRDLAVYIPKLTPQGNLPE